MVKMVVVSLVIIILLGPGAALGASPVCARSTWSDTRHLSNSRATPCLDEVPLAGHSVLHLHAGSCTCALLPALTSEATITSLARTHLERLYWPQSATVLPLTPPPRAL